MPPLLPRHLIAACLAAALGPGHPRAAAAEPCRAAVIHVHKARGELSLRCGGRTRYTFAATFGGEPLRPKRRRGDRRTPEGRYRICSKARYRPLHIFLNLDYPGAADADRALARGQIGRAQHRQIRAAHRRRRCPRGITALGSGIGIHGAAPVWAGLVALWQQLSRVAGLHRYLGFTRGCILLANDDLERLWPHVEAGETEVVIHGRARPAAPAARPPGHLPLAGLVRRLLGG